MIAGVVADDLTGALEVGALAAAQGIPTSVVVGGTRAAAVAGATDDLVVVDAETRRPAADREARFAAGLAIAGAALPRLYVKIDSTLRGAIGAHLAATSRCTGRPLVLVPAYPALGRTVVDGLLLVDGRPLTSTAFAADVHQPVRSSSVLDLFSGIMPAVQIRTAGDLRRQLAAGAQDQVFVCDASSEADLDAIAEVVDGSRAVLAGSGGFAGRWLRTVLAERRATPAFPAVTRPVLICGSRHPTSLTQATAAEQAGIPVLRPPDGPGVSDPATVAAALGQRAAVAIDELRADLVVVFGGDTAFATLQALGCDAVQPLGELLPGVPVSRPRDGGPAFVTKAGGFAGADDVVAAVLGLLAGAVVPVVEIEP